MSFPLSSRHPAVSAAILAGGSGTRMRGAAKAFLEVGGAAILDRQIQVLRPRFAEIFVAAAPQADPAPFQARGLGIVADLYPGAGPMAGLHAALAACRTPWLFVVACDMPFLDGDLIDRLIGFTARDPASGAFVPMRDGRAEPLHSLYRAALAAAAERCLKSGRRAMTDLLDRVATRYIEESDLPGLTATRSLSNLNTPEDLAMAEGGG